MFPSSKPSTKPSMVAPVFPSMKPRMIPSAAPSMKLSQPPTVSQQYFQSNSELTTEGNNWFGTALQKTTVENTYGPIGDWCFVAGVTSMYQLFFGRSTFNEDISNWDVSAVTNMEGVFDSASNFNQDLSSWDVSSVTNMQWMFGHASSFNQDISSWDVSSVTWMSNMFYFASSFNRDLSSWDVSSVTEMAHMFFLTPYSQDLSSWDISSVWPHKMERMFLSASSLIIFNQNLCAWRSRLPAGANVAFALFCWHKLPMHYFGKYVVCPPYV